MLHSFLHYCVGDDLQYMHYGFSVKLGYISTELAGALLTLFLLGIEAPRLSDTLTILIDNGVHFENQVFRIFRNGLIDCRILS